MHTSIKLLLAFLSTDAASKDLTSVIISLPKGILFDINESVIRAMFYSGHRLQIRT